MSTPNAPTLSSIAASSTSLTITLTPPAADDYDHTQAYYRLRGGAAWMDGGTYEGTQGVEGSLAIEGLESGQTYEVVLVALDASSLVSLPSITLRSTTSTAGPIHRQILDRAKTVLEGITEANGYFDTLEAVYLASVPADLRDISTPFAVVDLAGSSADLKATEGTYGLTTHKRQLHVMLGSKRSTSDVADSEWVVDEAARLYDACVKAILESDAFSPLVVDIIELSSEEGGTEQDLADAVASVTFEITYRTQSDNPSVKRP